MFLEILLGCLLIFLLYKSCSKPSYLPPGTFGIPLLGDVNIVGVKLTQYILDMRKKYGSIFTTRMGSKVVVVLTDHNMIKKAFNLPQLQGRMKIHTTLVFTGSVYDGILMAEHNTLLKNRRFMLKNLKDLGLGKSSLEISIQDEASQLVKYLDNQDLTKPVKLDWSINVCVLNIIWQMLASKRYEFDDQEIIEYAAGANEDVEIARGPAMNLSMISSMPLCLVRILTNIDTVQNHKEGFANLVMDSIKFHEDTLNSSHPRDFIDYYLLEKKNDAQTEKIPDELKYEELIIIMHDMFTAGTETTSSTIRWFFLLMAIYPEVQQKIHDSLDANIPDHRQPSLQDRQNLDYLQAVILETLRYSSLVPTGLIHRVTETINFEGYTLPKDTNVMAALEVVHRDPKLWEKPYEFYPEHFLTEDGRILTVKEGFMPFAIGKRQCIGEALARVELFLVTSTLLQNFKIVPPPGVKLDDGLDNNTHTFNHCKDYEVILQRRIAGGLHNDT